MLGLLIEFVSVAVTIRKHFWGYYKRLENGTFQQEIKKDKKEGIIVLLFLCIGMFLQGLSTFV